MTRSSSNHPSARPAIINVKGEPFKKYVFADDVLKKITSVNGWKSLKHLDPEMVEVLYFSRQPNV